MTNGPPSSGVTLVKATSGISLGNPASGKSFRKGKAEVSAVFGQTCDGLDVISQSELLPELEIEDLVYSENIGAYSNASATWFNGFPPAKVVHVNE